MAMTNTEVVVRIKERATVYFKINNGVNQRDILSIILVSIAFNLQEICGRN